MLQRRHLGRRVIVVHLDILVLVCNHNRLGGHIASVEDLVQAVAARVHLQRVREKHEDDDRELPNGNKERGGGVHRDDVRTDGGAKGEVPEDGDDLVGERRRADGAADDDVHALLRVVLELIEDGEELRLALVK